MVLELDLYVLEYQRRDTKKKGTEEAITYHNLIAYEFGREFPELTKIKVPDHLVGSVLALEAGSHRLKLDMNLFKGQASFTFMGVAA